MVRYGAAALALVAAAAIAAISPFASTLVEQWSRQDIELRSALVFNPYRMSWRAFSPSDRAQQIVDLFDRLAVDDRLIAVGFCDREGRLLYEGKGFSRTLTCAQFGRTDTTTFSSFGTDGRDMMVGTFPIGMGASSGHLVLLHDLSFAEQRGAIARNWILIALGGVALVGAALASIIALIITQNWLRAMRRVIRAARANHAPAHGLPARFGSRPAKSTICCASSMTRNGPSMRTMSSGIPRCCASCSQTSFPEPRSSSSRTASLTSTTARRLASACKLPRAASSPRSSR